MIRELLQRAGILILTAIFIVIAFIPLKATDYLQYLVDEPVVKAKSEAGLPMATQEFLLNRNTDTARVWALFTDKGVFTKEDFSARAASVQLSEKVLKRRAKVGRDKVLFIDLPVEQSYVEKIIERGGKLRRISKWLNAASFDIPMNKLNVILQLPFVSEIRPVAGFKRPDEPVKEIRVDDINNQSLAPDALDYGISQAQLEQIHIPAVHNMGYDGSGVTLAIFDTGFRKSHEAFANHYLEGRVLAEWDFVFNDGNTANEAGDWSSQWDHGTFIWSTSGGFLDGSIYGPAYRANFILAKTEDVRSETSVEEDNWIAAMEWVDSLGADVITSSLTYSDWYTPDQYDGQTALITIAANTATSLGIVVCNAMGNSGPGASTMLPPADAFEILSCGAVDINGNIASFSSRGPTADGRMKPEVCARGVSTACASSVSDNSYTAIGGTSLSTPLIAGAACLLIQARPNFPPQLIRLALMETADNAATPDNTYGWGVINLEAALGWGAKFSADTTYGQAPLTVHFTDESSLSSSTWKWSFGDGDSAFVQNPTHTYTDPGYYNVSLTINTAYGDITNMQEGFIVLLGDTMTFQSDSIFAGQPAVMSVKLKNSQPLNRIIIPFTYGDSSLVGFDSVTLGTRTSYFERIQFLTADQNNKRYTIELMANIGGGSPPLPAGDGEVMKIFFSTDPYAFGGRVDNVDSTNSTYSISLDSPFLTYTPEFYSGLISTIFVIRGDVDHSLDINVADISYYVDYLFSGGIPPVSLQAGDIAVDFAMNVNDLSYLVAYLFEDGPPPPSP